MKEIGTTQPMPGAIGFTMAAFPSNEVPDGTRLFMPSGTEISHRNDLMAVLFAVFTHFGAEGVWKVTGDALKTRDQEPPPCPICSGDCAGANPPVMNCPVQRENDLKRALAPLVAIADAYDASNLDEARPEWTKPEGVTPEQIELYAGRGGKRLLTLAHCLKAREVAR